MEENEIERRRLCVEEVDIEEAREGGNGIPRQDGKKYQKFVGSVAAVGACIVT